MARKLKNETAQSKKTTTKTTQSKSRRPSTKKATAKKPTLRDQVNTLNGQVTSLNEQVQTLELDNAQLHEIASENHLKVLSYEVTVKEKESLLEEIKEKLEEFVTEWKASRNFFKRFIISFKLVRQIIDWAEEAINKLSN